VKTLSRGIARLLTATTVSAAALLTTGAFTLPASAGPVRSATHPLTVRQIASGEKLHHKFRPGGTGAWHTEPLTGPDDLTVLGRDLYVAFQNGIGPQGQASTDGNLDSTVVEFSLSGQEIRQWDVKGHADGLTADPSHSAVIATVNEDANSSLYTISPVTGRVTHYAYNESLPHKGGTDAISVYRGRILISASAPGTTGAAAPRASYPAVYVVTLNARTKVATVRPLYYDESLARLANGTGAGKLVRLALTDPDSNEVVPWQSPRFGGDFMLDSQGDQELIFDHPDGWRPGLTVLRLPRSVNDSAWATAPFGALYASDSGADTVDAVFGRFPVGTMYSAATPCDSNSAPATCPAPGFPANYLATVNLRTGSLVPVPLTGAALQPGGLIFVRF
jgi:hypothetical protein